MIKRVIALPGDILGLTDGKILVNGVVINESYLPADAKTDDLGKLTAYTDSPIPEGFLAVMGDNREESFDSRMFGLIPFDNLVGKAFMVYWPPARSI